MGSARAGSNPAGCVNILKSSPSITAFTDIMSCLPFKIGRIYFSTVSILLFLGGFSSASHIKSIDKSVCVVYNGSVEGLACRPVTIVHGSYFHQGV